MTESSSDTSPNSSKEKLETASYYTEVFMGNDQELTDNADNLVYTNPFLLAYMNLTILKRKKEY